MNTEQIPTLVERCVEERTKVLRRMHLHDDGGDYSIVFNAGWDAALRNAPDGLSIGRDEVLEEAARVADAEREKVNEYVARKLGGKEGMERNTCRYQTARDIAAAIRALKANSNVMEGK